MDTGTKIKSRRKELGLSAEEVAARMGVSAATVYRYESSYISNMGIDKITPIAKALHTTEAFLLGWTDSADIPVDSLDWDEQEEHLLTYFRKLNNIGKDKAIDYLKDLVSSGNYTTISALSQNDTLQYNAVAAHDRTDIEVTDEMRAADDEIMDDDDF